MKQKSLPILISSIIIAFAMIFQLIRIHSLNIDFFVSDASPIALLYLLLFFTVPFVFVLGLYLLTVLAFELYYYLSLPYSVRIPQVYLPTYIEEMAITSYKPIYKKIRFMRC